jgi:hypothetical protein
MKPVAVNGVLKLFKFYFRGFFCACCGFKVTSLVKTKNAAVKYLRKPTNVSIVFLHNVIKLLPFGGYSVLGAF